jgi:hypothetical protein
MFNPDFPLERNQVRIFPVVWQGATTTQPALLLGEATQSKRPERCAIVFVALHPFRELFFLAKSFAFIGLATKLERSNGKSGFNKRQKRMVSAPSFLTYYFCVLQ